MTQYVIGIDIGTTCTKVVCIDNNGKIVGQGSKGYSLLSLGNRVEQKAEDWICATAEGIRQAVQYIDTSCIKGISCSTQGGSTVAVRNDHSFIGNAWTWMDRRSTKQADDALKVLGNDYIYRVTGSQMSPALDAAKIKNMKSCQEYADASYFWTTLEVINYWLTGVAVIDPSNAAMRQLLNIDTLYWDERILRFSNINEKELPKLYAAGTMIGYVSEAAAVETGIPAGIPVYNGAHDQYCASIGAGAIHNGDMLLSAGTTWVLMGITEKPMYTSSYICPGRHPIDGLYGVIASLVGSGASMEWFYKNFMSVDWEQINETVPLRNTSTRNLFFFPYVNGAPYPIHNSSATGIFAGIELRHDQFDFARAIMEGVAFGVKRAVDDFKQNGSTIDCIIMMGGASKSSAWMQMIASVTGISIKRLNCSDVCAVGAAMIAACGAGFYKNYNQAAEAMVKIEKIYKPIATECNYYNEKFKKFTDLWTALSGYYKGV